MNIVFIGAGNIAWHLSKALYDKGHKILQIYSRDLTNALHLAKFIGSAAINDLKNLNNKADLYIICVPDAVIPDIIEQLPNGLFDDQILVHTSGTVSSILLSKKAMRFGVFYPLQSFSKVKNIEFENIPIFISAESEKSFCILSELASQLTSKIVSVTDNDREKIHLAAVIVNNFSNHLFSLSKKYCEKENLEFQYLMPLIRETIEKLGNMSPEAAQTGPARRNDQTTIDRHLILLEKYPELKNIYQIFSNSIIKSFTK